MKISPWFLILSFTGVILGGCGNIKVAATGNEDEILVFADDSTWNLLQPAISHVFVDTVLTPQPERWFTIRRVSFDEFPANETVINRIVIAPLNGSGPVADFIRQALDPKVQTLVSDGKEYVFNKYDSKARGQLLMFLTTPDLPSLKSALLNNVSDLRYYFKSTALKRDLASFEKESRFDDRGAERSLAVNSGWTMTVQHDYVVAIDSSRARFFWMRRANPADMERWIFVSWADSKDPGVLTDRYPIKVRDSLTARYLLTIGNDAHVEIAPYNLQIQNVNFLGRFGYEMRGNWRFSDKSGGGPFVNYTFYDEKTRRIYMLDGSIFAPRVEKKKLILQVDALLHTFKTVTELSESQKSELKINQ